MVQLARTQFGLARHTDVTVLVGDAMIQVHALVSDSTWCLWTFSTTSTLPVAWIRVHSSMGCGTVVGKTVWFASIR